MRCDWCGTTYGDVRLCHGLPYGPAPLCGACFEEYMDLCARETPRNLLGLIGLIVILLGALFVFLLTPPVAAP